MLSDVELVALDKPILKRLAGGEIKVWHISTGVYLCNHHNFGFHIGQNYDKYLKDFELNYGVCDNPEQGIAKLSYWLHGDRKFVVAFTRLLKSEQPQKDGWRWHKWGPYIGTQKRQCEYLYDEPLIDEVYTFSVYELL